MRKDSVAPIQGQPARLRNSIFLSLSLIPSPPSLAIFAITSSAASRLPLKSRVSRRCRRTSFDGCPSACAACVRPSVRRMNVPLRTRKCCPIRRGQPKPQPVPEQSPSVRIKQVSNANREPKAQRGIGKGRNIEGITFTGRAGTLRTRMSDMERSVRGRGLAPFFLRTASIALGMGAPEFSTDNDHI